MSCDWFPELSFAALECWNSLSSLATGLDKLGPGDKAIEIPLQSAPYVDRHRGHLERAKLVHVRHWGHLAQVRWRLMRVQ
jgi:hypothetical protein